MDGARRASSQGVALLLGLVYKSLVDMELCYKGRGFNPKSAKFPIYGSDISDFGT